MGQDVRGSRTFEKAFEAFEEAKSLIHSSEYYIYTNVLKL